ncbi:MAE_28990/MAE_18760 family HEPN-like nuclease [Nostoc sp. LEGE 12450]|uniref:MAE_28990/MAE_18760 family HEPN-like nuclease n=1 Tax=Nostoc sp. LEGE 12450 TaxID=1828643 RepID=UPI001882A95C|nr:MAE_28990/MAE_18760 family HEPN-like nuclease [Nostoc sp. LEGE 12450]MBE8989394.1 hypothetical protein [Nostoc sp. LEGE 12450]
MESNAKQKFDKNCEDINKLLEFHESSGGSSPGRRYGLEVLNKSAVVLICAIWEAYCEDIAAEGLEHIVNYATSSDNLSTEIKKQVAKSVKDDQNQLAVWSLADDGWRNYLRNRLTQLQEKRNRQLNTPITVNIDKLFDESLAIKNISHSWRWKKMSATQAALKLDKYINLRGSIAHRGSASETVKKQQVEAFLKHVQQIVDIIESVVFTYITQITSQDSY